LPDLFVLEEDERVYWELRTNGVEPRIGRHFNEWALGPVCEGLTCPDCRAYFKTFADADDAARLAPAIGEWIKQSATGLVCCPQCGNSRSIAEWECKPPLGFGNLSFSFWNWPPLDSPSWNIDIMELVKQITGHKIIYTYGHI